MRFKPSSCYTKKQDGCSSSGVAFLRASVPMRFVTSTCNPGRKGHTIKPTPCRSRNSLRTNPALSQLPSFFNILKCKSSSRESLVHFLSTAFPDRGPETRDTDPTFATPGATILVKTHGFARESGFTRKFTCSRIVTLL